MIISRCCSTVVKASVIQGAGALFGSAVSLVCGLAARAGVVAGRVGLFAVAQNA